MIAATIPATSIQIIVFLGLFGVLFLFVGIRRLLEAGRGQASSGALLWGTVGILMAGGFLGAAAWTAGVFP